MSKYIIQMTTDKWAIQYLDAINFQYYLFLIDEKLIPDEEGRTHIEETYNNVISPGVTFGYFKLYSGRKTVVEGWALKQKGPLRKSWNDWPTSELKIKSAQVRQISREYERMIIVKYELGRPPHCCNGGASFESSGFFHIDLDYKIQIRAKELNPQHYSRAQKDIDGWDYFKIPKEENLLTYVPSIKDKAYGPSPSDHVIEYTPERHKVLEAISTAGSKLGEELRTLLQNKKLELPGDGISGLIGSSNE